MKWYSKNKRQCLDLDKISYWDYSMGELKIYINSCDPLYFRYNDAEEIYNLLLTEPKEIIKNDTCTL